MLKLDKSIIDKELHPKNIWFIFIVFDVSKLESSTDVKELHPKNIELISVTKELSKLSKSIFSILSALES